MLNVYIDILGNATIHPDLRPPYTSPTAIHILDTSGRAKVEVWRKEGQPTVHKDIACAMQNIIASCTRATPNGGLEVVGKYKLSKCK